MVRDFIFILAYLSGLSMGGLLVWIYVRTKRRKNDVDKKTSKILIYQGLGGGWVIRGEDGVVLVNFPKMSDVLAYLTTVFTSTLEHKQIKTLSIKIER